MTIAFIAEYSSNSFRFIRCFFLFKAKKKACKWINEVSISSYCSFNCCGKKNRRTKQRTLHNY